MTVRITDYVFVLWVLADQTDTGTEAEPGSFIPHSYQHCSASAMGKTPVKGKDVFLCPEE